MKELRVGILFGGRSGEHEVSLLSVASVLNAIDKDRGVQPRLVLMPGSAGYTL
jgi:D-alanine-D-alanine ligase-like ATP-grasp enzyme